MIARRKIWLTALLLCILGTLLCIGCGVWLRGVGWHVERNRSASTETRVAEGKFDEMRLVLIGQITMLLGASVFLILTLLLAVLGRRLETDRPPVYSDTTDIWRRGAPPDDNAVSLEDQWKENSGRPEDN